MKISVVLLLFCLVHVSASVDAQNDKIKVKEQKVSLSELLWKIQSKTNFVFAFSADKVEPYAELNVDVEGNVEEVLHAILEDTNLSFEIRNGVYVITYKVAEEVAQQQEKKITITGTITDDNGEPLPFAAIRIKGTTIGTVSDVNGNYNLQFDEQENVILEVSSLGFETSEVIYKGKSTIHVTLIASTEGLDEVVVTGYQTLSRERTTGSFSQISNEVFEQRMTTDIVESLEANVAGLYVDGENRISIRGIATLYGDSNPLIVVDGFPVEADLNTINTDDVESIQVLKDAAATSIWGVRAANGVIVITTKMGSRNEKAVINASYYFSMEEKPNLSDLNLINSSDRIDYKLESIAGGEWNPAYVSFRPQVPLDPLQQAIYDQFQGHISESEYNAIIEKLRNTDGRSQVEEYLLRNSSMHKLNISVSGGNEKNNYYSSITYIGNKSISVGNKDHRINVNLKNDYSITDKLSLVAGANLTLTELTNNGLSPYQLVREEPYKAIVDKNGDPVPYYMVEANKGKELEDLGYLSYTTNPLEEIKHNDNVTKGFTARLQLGLDYKFTPELSIHTKFQYERGYSKNNNLKSINHFETRREINTFTLENNGVLTHQLPLGATLETRKNDQEAWTWRNQLSYNASFDDDKHQVAAIAVAEIRKYGTSSYNTKLLGYDPQTLAYKPINESEYLTSLWQNAWYGRANIIPNPFTSMGESDNRDVSFMTNGSYTYNSKYTLTMSGRVDQSNLFGSSSEFRYKPLWSAGLSWKFSDEDFFKGMNWLDKAMLRATYGTGGNANKKFFPVLMGNVKNAYQGNYNYISLTNPANDKLKWETSKMLNIGLDWSVFSHRLWGSIEFYRKNTEDVIGRMSLDPTNGWDAANVNFASLNNKGMEISFNAIPYRNGGFKWETNLNVASNKNEVTDVGVLGATTNNYLANLTDIETLEWYMSFGLSGSAGIPIKGKPLDRVFAYKWGGLSNTGDPMIYNENDELVVYNEYSRDPKALKFMGSITPKVYGNFRNTFSYKGLSVAFNFNYKFGHVFRAMRTGSSRAWSGATYNNLADRWQKPGDEAITDVPSGKYPSFWFRSREDYYLQSDINVLKGDLIRLQDLSISYSLPKNLLAKIPFESLSIKVQGRNLWLWTANDEGIDPDRVPGEFDVKFPTPQSYIFGIKASF